MMTGRKPLANKGRWLNRRGTLRSRLVAESMNRSQVGKGLDMEPHETAFINAFLT